MSVNKLWTLIYKLTDIVTSLCSVFIICTKSIECDTYLESLESINNINLE